MNTIAKGFGYVIGFVGIITALPITLILIPCRVAWRFSTWVADQIIK